MRSLTCRRAASSGQPPRRRKRPIDLEQDHRHVVVLIGAADERLDLAQDALAQLAGVEVAVLLDDPAEARLAEQIAVGFIASVMPSVKSTMTSPGAEIDALLFEQLARTSPRAPSMRSPSTMPFGVSTCAAASPVDGARTGRSAACGRRGERHRARAADR